MTLIFEPLDLNKQDLYFEYLSRCSLEASDYRFINLWGWTEAYGLEWAWTDQHVWIKQNVPEEIYWAPVGSWEKIDWKAQFNKYFNAPIKFTRVPEALHGIWAKTPGIEMACTESRGHWDYVYAVDDLVELKGNRFHKKKNLVNQFKKKYTYSYFPFTLEMIHKALAMQQDWCTWRDCESFNALAAENKAIEKVLNSWDKLKGLLGGTICVDDEIIAYTVGEMLSEDTVVIHFEKGKPEFKGVYQAINQMFLEDINKSQGGIRLKFVNREQDLDDEGLRKAKLSYHPVGFVKKYHIKVD